MLTRLASLANSTPRMILMAAVVILVAAGAFGAQVTTLLPAGGYDDPESESSRANHVLAEKFGVTGMAIVFEITSSNGVDSVQAARTATSVVRILKTSPNVNNVQSYWAGGLQSPSLRSSDGRSGLVVAQVAGNDSEAPKRAQVLADTVGSGGDGSSISAGGLAIAYSQANAQSKEDLERAELIALPLTAVILVWAFGNLLAAAIPLAVALFAIACTNAALRALNEFTDVSVFAVSLATPLCLALAIDYSMFIVGRYREELARGSARDQALVRTLNTAGRTVLYSGATVGLSLAAMALFPMYFLRSLAYGGLIGVAMSSIGALVVAPALIALIGTRLDSRRLLKLIPARFRSPIETTPNPHESAWYRIARFVMRHAGVFAIAITILLVGLGLPILRINFAYPDDRVLPSTASARQVGDDLREDYQRDSTASITVVLPDRASASDSKLSAYAEELSKTVGVLDVTGPTGLYAGGKLVSGANNTTPSFTADRSAYFRVSTHADPTSEEGRQQLDELRSVPAPSSALFTGLAQQSRDNADGIVSAIPKIFLLIATSTIILIFLLTNSILLPFKALIMNTLSLTAAFGAIVWIFQDGHLGGLGTLAFGFLAAQIPPLIFCAAFGLSMDYEVFVLARIREEWSISSKSTADNSRAIAVGIARCGPIVTTAAVIMAVVFLALLTAEVSFTRMLGFGLAVTVLVDAFFVRALLVPAVMHLAGRANWWAPTFLRRFHIGHDGPRSGEPPSESADSAQIGRDRTGDSKPGTKQVDARD